MNQLRRLGSKLGLRPKEKYNQPRFSDIIFEDPFEEEGWPQYDPTAYERAAESRVHPFIFDEDLMDSQVTGTTMRIPGAPPETFQEWGQAVEYPQTQYDPTAGSEDTGFLQSIYGGTELPRFGHQYGVKGTSRRSGGTNGANRRSQDQTTIMRFQSLNPYEDMLQNADADLQRAYLESLKLSNSHAYETNPIIPQVSSPIPRSSAPKMGMDVASDVAPLKPFVTSEIPPTSCIICTEDFSAKVKPPGWISLACLHEPSVCRDCLAKCIKSDLDNKIWNQIMCPECSTLLIYEDIKRLADAETFSRYETLSFRSAVGADANFVWCQKCDFGQLHDSGLSQPIIRCLNCNFRSCFRHQVPWHERLTCDEYDQMVQNPDGFKSAIDRDDEELATIRKLQQQEDERFARELSQRDKKTEQDRQKQLHAEERRRAKAEQEAEAERKRAEQERVKMREELKRRQKEEKLSLAKVQSTTKRCPGCQWPIEKNEGCAHMTCIKCRHEFCWHCVKPWSGHGSRCFF